MKLQPWLEPAWQQFRQQLEQDHLGHALLVQGAAGTGKRALAEAMGARLVCTADQEWACGQCRSCTLYRSGAHPDFTLLEPEEDKHVIPVKQARALISSLALTTSFSERKVALIVPAEAMHKSAANALLKNLEEPPGHAFLILVAHDASRLPVTIRSRCHAIVVRGPDKEAAAAWLQQQGVEAKQAQAALAAAGGSPGLALAYAREGMVDTHRKLVRGLDAALEEPGAVRLIAEEFKDVAAETLWTWLSHCSAAAFRAASTGERLAWLKAGRSLQPRRLAALQRDADRNRMLAKTSVRQDLLLLEWLLEWASQARQ